MDPGIYRKVIFQATSKKKLVCVPCLRYITNNQRRRHPWPGLIHAPAYHQTRQATLKLLLEPHACLCAARRQADWEKPMIRFHTSWLRTALVAAVAAAAMPAMAFAQPVPPTTSPVATGLPAAQSTAPACAPACAVGTADRSQADRQAGTGTAGSVSSGPTSRNDFYLRAGVVLDRSEKTRFKDADCTSTSPAALYGCGNGIDNAPLSSLGDFGTMAGFELGLGYAVAPALRLEAVIQYRPNFSFEGRANFTQTTDQQAVSADLSSLTGMLAAYLDLPELGLPRPGPFSPFIGAGGGLSRINIDETHMAFPKTTTIVPGGQRGNFAWMLVAGFAASPREKITLDLAWRYTDHGTVETGRAKGRIVWRDGNRDPLEIDLAGTRADLRGHGLRLSLRYAF